MSAPREEVTVREIVAATGGSKVTTLRRALRESWPFREEPCPGRPRRFYDVSALPADIRERLDTPDATPADVSGENRAREKAGAGTGPAPVSAPADGVDTMSETVPPEDALERRWERLPEARRQRAADRLALVDAAVAVSLSAGVSMRAACERVSGDGGHPCSAATLLRWWRRVRDLPRPRRVMALADGRSGGTAEAPLDPAAWEAFKADWMRPEQPTLAACGRRLRRLAEANGWTVPASDAALLRRIRREVPPEAVTLSRRGPEALGRMVPPQIRDREALASMECVCADGHTWDVRVRWEDGSEGRPVGVFWQDSRSGKLLSWRIGRSETSRAYRLSLADTLWRHGAPEHAIIDNGRGIASKASPAAPAPSAATTARAAPSAC